MIMQKCTLGDTDLSNAASARSWMNIYGLNDFGDKWAILQPLCFADNGWPYGIRHVRCFNSLYGNSLSPTAEAQLTSAYVYLASSFFCLDHICDGESCNQFDEALGASLFICGAADRVTQVCALLGREIQPELVKLRDLYMTFAEAMRSERETRRNWEIVNDAQDIEHEVRRSSVVLYAYRLVGRLTGRESTSEAIAALELLIRSIQEGDDWGDWREDFASKNWTPFLRRCAAQMGYMPSTEPEMERFIYLSGAYEEQGRAVIAGLREAGSILSAQYGASAAGFVEIIDRSASRANSVCEAFDSVKSGARSSNFSRGLQFDH